MKPLNLFIVFFLTIIILPTKVFSEEIKTVPVDCQQQAIDAGYEAGEEFDMFIVDCEMSNEVEDSFIDESASTVEE
jgi:hypothetical protein